MDTFGGLHLDCLETGARIKVFPFDKFCTLLNVSSWRHDEKVRDSFVNEFTNHFHDVQMTMSEVSPSFFVDWS